MQNFKMLIAYDGSRYRGWQRLGNSDATIQGKIETVLGRLFEKPIEIVGSGRTDAGVHARGQVANFWVETEKCAEEICQYLRQYLPEDIGILSVDMAPERFHSRLSAVEKTYCYRIWNDAAPNVFERKFMMNLPDNLDLCKMQKGAELLLGRHDFRSFCANKHFKKSSVRTISRFEIEKVDRELRFIVAADGFLHHMVRILVGTLLEIGQGKRTAESIPTLLEIRDRAQAGFTVPPQGLCLMEVRY